jgi:hypothetical protein
VKTVTLLKIALIASLFVGCSSKKEVAQKGIEKGSKDPIAMPNFYMIRFSDNIFGIHLINKKYKKDSLVAIDMTMVQSAKIAIKNGYKYFVLIDKKENIDKDYTDKGFSSIVFADNTYFITKPSSTNTIVCFEETPELIGNIYNAKEIIKKMSGNRLKNKSLKSK